MYAQIVDGAITHRGGLPKNTKAVSGFNLQSDAELKALGWLPMTEVGVTLGADETSDGETVSIGANSVTVTAKKRSMTAAEITAHGKSEAAQQINVLEEAITPRRMREAALGTDAGWMATQDGLIATERAKLA